MIWSSQDTYDFLKKIKEKLKKKKNIDSEEKQEIGNQFLNKLANFMKANLGGKSKGSDKNNKDKDSVASGVNSKMSGFNSVKKSNFGSMRKLELKMQLRSKRNIGKRGRKKKKSEEAEEVKKSQKPLTPFGQILREFREKNRKKKEMEEKEEQKKMKKSVLKKGKGREKQILKRNNLVNDIVKETREETKKKSRTEYDITEKKISQKSEENKRKMEYLQSPEKEKSQLKEFIFSNSSQDDDHSLSQMNISGNRNRKKKSTFFSHKDQIEKPELLINGERKKKKSKT